MYCRKCGKELPENSPFCAFCGEKQIIRSDHTEPKTAHGIEERAQSSVAKASKLHGHGSYVFSSGDAYDGEFRDGELHGWGSYVHSNGDSYEGEYKNGERNGQGKMNFANGDSYEGEWLNGKRDGIGAYTFANGDVHVGSWEKGSFLG